MEESDTESSSVKDLVPLDWFTQKQEYRLFDYILENIDYIIDDLEEKNRVMSLGLISSDGGNYKGALRNIGDFYIQDDLLCRGLSVIGRAMIKGLLIVDGSTTILGRSKFLDHCIFGGNSEIKGTANFATHILTSGDLRIGGKVNVKGNVYADSPIYLSGTIKMKNIRSTSMVNARAAIFVKEDIYADEFVLSKGGGEVGSITARFVTVGFKDRSMAKMYKGSGEKRNLVNPINLFRFVTGSVKHMISRHPKGSKILEVHGDINAEEIYLSNCKVHGGVKGNNIIIGPDVTISGVIEYSEKLELPKNSETMYNAKMIEAEKD